MKRSFALFIAFCFLNIQPGHAQAQAAANQDSVAPGSPEDRLAKLNALYKKGLITKQDYDTKKAAILKEM